MNLIYITFSSINTHNSFPGDLDTKGLDLGTHGKKSSMVRVIHSPLMHNLTW